MRDATLSTEVREKIFNEYITGYYPHKDPKSHNLDDLQRTPDPNTRPSHIPEITSEQIAELSCYDSVTQSEIPIRSAMPAMYHSFARRALCEPSALACFPKCRVDVLWCENTAWECVGAVWTLEDLAKEAQERKIECRKFRSIMIPGPGANHFVSCVNESAIIERNSLCPFPQVHWDDPEKAMDYFAEVASSAH